MTDESKEALKRRVAALSSDLHDSILAGERLREQIRDSAGRLAVAVKERDEASRERDDLIDRCKALRARCRDLLRQLQRPEPCDVCIGDPSSVEGDCACGGTGLMTDTIAYMRVHIAEMHAEHERLQTLVKAAGHLLKAAQPAVPGGPTDWRSTRDDWIARAALLDTEAGEGKQVPDCDESTGAEESGSPHETPISSQPSPATLAILRRLVDWIDHPALARVTALADTHGVGLTADECTDGHKAIAEARTVLRGADGTERGFLQADAGEAGLLLGDLANDDVFTRASLEERQKASLRGIEEPKP